MPRRAAVAATTLVALAAIAAPAWGSPPARPDTQGISASRTAASEPHWACAHGLCDAIVDPRPSTSAGLGSDVFKKKKPEGGGEEGGIDPEELRAAYGIPVTGGAGQTIAVIEGFAYKQAEKDLGKYRAHYGIPACTTANGCLTIANSEGKAPGNHGFTEWEPEVALDLDMASAACPECHIMLVSAEAENWKALGAAVDYAAAHGASEISNSYGLAEETCESGECAEAAPDWNHPGLFVSVSSGDYGYDNELALAATPSFPASLPTVAAVGGTALRKARNKRGFSEKVWGERSLGVGTGSGCSVEPKPLWQVDVGCKGRTENDVAAVGACATPVSVFDSTEGGWIDLCGTSVSSPLVAGIEAHASAAARAEPGGRAFYSATNLFDVTSGSNGRCTTAYLCHGEVGYDGPSGNGTPLGPLP